MIGILISIEVYPAHSSLRVEANKRAGREKCQAEDQKRRLQLDRRLRAGRAAGCLP